MIFLKDRKNIVLVFESLIGGTVSCIYVFTKPELDI